MSFVGNIWRTYKVLIISVPTLVGLHYGWYNLQFNEEFVPESQRPKKAGFIEFPKPQSEEKGQ